LPKTINLGLKKNKVKRIIKCLQAKCFY
jgi:hypothetical protein